MQKATAQEINNLVASYFAALVNESQQWALAEAHLSDFEKAEKLDAAEDAAIEIREFLAVKGEHKEIAASFVQFATDKGVTLDGLPPPLHKLAINSAMAAHLEHIGYLQHVAETPDAPFKPSYPALEAALNAVAANATLSDTGASAITLEAALAKFWNERSSQWAASTKPDAKLTFQWLKEHLGPDTVLHSIKKPQAAAFRGALLRLEKRSKSKTFKDRQTDDPSKQIAQRTAAKYLDFTHAFFNWAAGEAGFLEHSPFDKLTIKVVKQKSNAAKAATPEQLKAFLMSPLFQGHKYKVVHEEGSLVARDEPYWLMLIAFYYGPRIGEIAQLGVADIKTKASPPHIHFRKTDDQGNPIGGNTLKTVNAERKVPIGGDLIELGFLEFVERQTKKGERLFPSFVASEGQKASSKASKFASRYLERIGQKALGKATHWFRHGLYGALENAQTPEYSIKKIVGHAQTGMQGIYGNTQNLEASKKALEAADYQFDPLAILLLSKKRWLK